MMFAAQVFAVDSMLNATIHILTVQSVSLLLSVGCDADDVSCQVGTTGTVLGAAAKRRLQNVAV